MHDLVVQRLLQESLKLLTWVRIPTMSQNLNIMGELLIYTEVFEREPEKFEIFRTWGTVEAKIIKFQNKATLRTFVLLYESDGMRLLKHFKNDCQGNFRKFETYLTREQYNTTLLNIVYNHDFFI